MDLLTQSNTKRCFCFITRLLVLVFCSCLVNGETSLSEPQAKAALLYNFIKHTQWPDEKNLKSFDVLFVDYDSGFYRAFNQIAAEANIRGKTITVQRKNQFDNGRDYQVVVVGKNKNKQLNDIANRLLRSSTLLITDDVEDQKVVMINFRYPSEQSLSFEINRSNIIFEGLSISNDVLLYGGTEIEVATLYKEMALSLQNIKANVQASQQQLLANRHQLQAKTLDIQKQKQKMAVVSNELAEKSSQLELQQKKLSAIRGVLASNEKTLADKQAQLEQREALVANLESQIEGNRQTLQKQQSELARKQGLIAATSAKVINQKQTINYQRNLIIASMALLIVGLLVVLSRLKRTLKRERLLLDAEAALVKRQAASIDAYEANIQLKNDFLTAINHELRTPMSGILGAIQVADKNDMQNLQSAFEMVEQSAHQMMCLVDDVLTYTEQQSGVVSDHRECISTAQLLADCKQRAVRACTSKGTQLRWTPSSDLPDYLAIDSDKFTKLMDKLVDNAVKFTDVGCVDISFCVAEENAEHYLCCEIIDTGSGIPTKQIEHIFEPFWQAESGFTRRYSGLGIGLTISKQLVESMGGSISVSSLQSKGCTVNFCCGYDVVAAPEKKQLKAVNPADVRTILVVEDNIVNQKVLQKMLEKLGYKSVVAEHGEEALFLIDRLRFAAILMDLQMPKMDGFACTEEIRRRKDYYQYVPIIAVTANLMDSQQEKCIQAGMNAYLAKPVDLTRLQETLQAVLLDAQGCD